MDLDNEIYRSIFADQLLKFLAAMAMFYLVMVVITIVSWPIVKIWDTAAKIIEPFLRRHAIKIIILHYSLLATLVAFTILVPIDKYLKEVIIVSAFGWGFWSWVIVASYLSEH